MEHAMKHQFVSQISSHFNLLCYDQDVHDDGRDVAQSSRFVVYSSRTRSNVDPITDVFTAMRVDTIVYGRIELTAPWGLRFERGDYACFGTLARGNGWLTVEGL